MECGICFESYNNSSKKVYTHNYCFYQGEHKNLNKYLTKALQSLQMWPYILH